MILDQVHDQDSRVSNSHVRRRRSHRPFARRRTLARTSSGTIRPRVEKVPLTALQRRRRLDRVAAYLVRTMRACPAPGIAPLTTRDWLLISSVVLLPYLLIFGLAAIAPAR
jgi:hypothetical protein